MAVSIEEIYQTFFSHLPKPMYPMLQFNIFEQMGQSEDSFIHFVFGRKKKNQNISSSDTGYLNEKEGTKSELHLYQSSKYT